MHTLPLIWSNYFDGVQLENDAAISVQLCSGDLIQIDTGCPYSFLNYDFAVEQNIIPANYLQTTKQYTENELGHRFYFIQDFRFEFNDFDWMVDRCFLEINQTKDEKLKQGVYWENALNQQNVGYLGLDFLLNKLVVFAFKANLLQLHQPKNEKEHWTDLTMLNGYCIIPLTFNDTTYRVMFDTGSSSSGLILNRKFKSSFPDLSLIEETIIRNDFVQTVEKTHINASIKIGDNFHYDGSMKVEFPNEEFNEYLFYHNTFDAILGLKFLKNQSISLDFKNQRFSIN